MPVITYQNRQYTVEAGDVLLDALTNQGVALSYACRRGVCHTCMLQCMEGDLPEASQQGLKQTQREQNFFLACQCVPHTDLSVAEIDADKLFVETVVLAKEMLSPTVCRLRLQRPEGYEYRAGQFLNLRKDEHLIRSYSLASVPTLDDDLELHIKRIDDGRVSGWIHDELQPGDEVMIEEASGDCFYIKEAEDKPMLLVGTGTGLAPLIGIVRDALIQGHQGRIILYHGVRTADELYRHSQLNELAASHSNVEYTGCVSGASEDLPGELQAGRAADIAFTEHGDLKGWRIYLCGSPPMVMKFKKLAYLQGAAMTDIYTDAFELATPPALTE